MQISQKSRCGSAHCLWASHLSCPQRGCFVFWGKELGVGDLSWISKTGATKDQLQLILTRRTKERHKRCPEGQRCGEGEVRSAPVLPVTLRGGPAVRPEGGGSIESCGGKAACSSSTRYLEMVHAHGTGGTLSEFLPLAPLALHTIHTLQLHPELCWHLWTPWAGARPALRQLMGCAGPGSREQRVTLARTW